MSEQIIDPTRFSTWNKLLLTLATVLNLVFRIKKQRPKDQQYITEDVILAKNQLIKISQQNFFFSTIQALKRGSRIDSKCKIRSLNPMLVNHFWKRLVKEYLPTLLKRSKWSDSDQTPLRVNDIVWILKDMTPRGIWPLGRVLEVYPGRDGQHRVVKVKTAYGTYVRPVSALARVLAD